MLFWLFLALVGVMALFPETPTARFLHKWLVDKPAAFLNELTWWRAGVWCGLVVFLLVASISAPEAVVALASLGDAAVAFEIWMLVLASGVASGAAGVGRWLKQGAAIVFGLVPAIIARIRPQARKRSVRRSDGRRIKPPSDDPEPGWADLPALAA